MPSMSVQDMQVAVTWITCFMDNIDLKIFFAGKMLLVHIYCLWRLFVRWDFPHTVHSVVFCAEYLLWLTWYEVLRGDVCIPVHIGWCLGRTGAYWVLLLKIVDIIVRKWRSEIRWAQWQGPGLPIPSSACLWIVFILHVVCPNVLLFFSFSVSVLATVTGNIVHGVTF